MLSAPIATKVTTVRAAPFPIGTLSATDRYRICGRVADEGEVSLEVADEVLSDLLLYLSAFAAYPDIDFRPSKVIDRVWHELILHSKIYFRFCSSVGMTYIHHDPHDFANPRSNVGLRNVRDVLDELGLSYATKYWASEEADCSCKGCDTG